MAVVDILLGVEVWTSTKKMTKLKIDIHINNINAFFTVLAPLGY